LILYLPGILLQANMLLPVECKTKNPMAKPRNLQLQSVDWLRLKATISECKFLIFDTKQRMKIALYGFVH